MKNAVRPVGTVLVTGAGGFIGRAMVARLAAHSQCVVRAATRQARAFPPAIQTVSIDEIDGRTDWSHALSGVQVVIHLAGPAHLRHADSTAALAAVRRVNLDGSARLAKQAAEAGVRRLVFVSSVKVHGECGSYRETDPPSPRGAYAVSKHEAEKALKEIARGKGMDIVVVRPPLVYGPGARANFGALMRAVERGLPLPLGAVKNRRSLVALDNLTDFLCTCMSHEWAANETFLVSDDHDLSTPEIVRCLAEALKRPARLIAVPPALLIGLAAIAGRRAQAKRLLQSLQVDISKARERLGWHPPVSVAEGFSRAVAGHRC